MKNPNSKKLIISLYDLTTEWVKPYIEAGYMVVPWDYEVEGDIFQRGISHFQMLIEDLKEEGVELYGILSAAPCTEFAASGARWWEEKDKSSQACGERGEFKNSVEMHEFMAMVTLLFVEWYNPKFWVLENPVGRLEKLCPEFIQYRKMSFNPCDYGDPYTKKTILWGQFNTDLQKNQVQPLEGSKMHLASGWNKKAQKKERSTTPAGFARAFFEANQ